MRCLLAVLVLALPPLAGQTAMMPVDAVRPDMRGVARTVFRGQTVEEFPVQILGVMRHSGPAQDMIVAKLLTERLELTGVMQGMSGSPVYIDGKLVGAIAFAFPFAKEPIAGIRPIGEMLAVRSSPFRAAIEPVHLGANQVAQAVAAAESSVTQVLTPVAMGGFSARTIEHFAPQWKAMGFALQQGASGNAAAPAGGPIKPGDMISVQLLRGDMSAGADGTVTHVDGKRLYAFGHRFMGAGQVELPVARAEVITPLANLNTPFKISQSLDEVGALLLDGDAAVQGELGRKAKLTPVRIRFRDGGSVTEYKIEMARHPLLAPLLLQMALFSTLDHHYRSIGGGTVDVKGTVRFAGVRKPLEITGRYAGDNNLPVAASLGAAIPVAYFQQHVEDALVADDMLFELDARPGHDQWVIESASLSRRTAKPGDRLKVRAQLAASSGREQIIEEDFVVPAWVQPGETLTVTVADAFTTNLMDFRAFYQPGGPVFRSPEALVETLATLHPANAFYVRAFRASPGYLSGGKDLGNLPTSIAAMLQKSPGNYLPTYQSRVLDREKRLLEGVVSGSRTLTLEIEK